MRAYTGFRILALLPRREIDLVTVFLLFVRVKGESQMLTETWIQKARRNSKQQQ